jgi:hypothetical protein
MAFSANPGDGDFFDSGLGRRRISAATALGATA